MKKQSSNWHARLLAALLAAVFALIAATAGFIYWDARRDVLKDLAARCDALSRTSREYFLPELDLFRLHSLVSEQARDRLVSYAVVTDADGRILSHTFPERIGARDETVEGRAARRAETARRQTFEGADGQRYYYFSSPIILGGVRFGTAAVAANGRSVAQALADMREKLLIILAAALLALLLLTEIVYLLRRERAAARLKSEMVHMVSHEFNNALMSIDACIYMLHDSEAAKDSARESTYRTIRGSSRLLKLYVKNILNEARMEAGKFKIEKKRVEFSALARETLAALEELVRLKRIQVTTEFPADCSLVVEADPEALAMVVSNLIGNAIKYTPRGGKISVVLLRAAEPPAAVFRVEDNGVGLSPDDLEKIKTGFYRAASGRHLAAGFGLGLKISNDMLGLHGSVLEVKSEPGVGSSFGFSLPLLASDCREPDAAGPA